MPTPYLAKPISIGLNDDTWKLLSSSEASSFLRVMLNDTEGRTYSSVALFPTADGRDLYVKAH